MAASDAVMVARGEFREEDQRCCALVAAGLARAGYQTADETTRMVLARWEGRGVTEWRESRSVDYLTRSGQLRDLDFILAHLNDLDRVFTMEEGEVVGRRPVSGERAAALGRADLQVQPLHVQAVAPVGERGAGGVRDFVPGRFAQQFLHQRKRCCALVDPKSFEDAKKELEVSLRNRRAYAPTRTVNCRRVTRAAL